MIFLSRDLPSRNAGRQVSAKTVALRNWINDFIIPLCAETNDSRLIKVKGSQHKQLYLPSSRGLVEYFLEYRSMLKNEGTPLLQIASSDLFYATMARDFPYVHTTPLNSFVKCSKCREFEELADRLVHEGFSSDSMEMRSLNHRRSVHNDDQRSERMHYYNLKDLASNPEHLVIIIDGMTKIAFPKGPFTHLWQPFSTLGSISPMGLINHSNGDHMLYTSFGQWPGNQDTVLTVLFDYLRSYFAKITIRPKTLYLHLDNCVPQNKNRIFFAFCAYLVHLGWFERIELSYQITGHTHEDIDQWFSTISASIRGKTFYSFEQFRAFVCNVYRKDPPKIVELTHCYAFANFFQYAANEVENSGILHGFAFSKVDNQVVMEIRARNLQVPWHQQALQVLAELPDQSELCCYEPVLQFDHRQISAMLRGCQCYLPHGSEPFQFWSRYLEDPRAFFFTDPLEDAVRFLCFLFTSVSNPHFHFSTIHSPGFLCIVLDHSALCFCSGARAAPEPPAVPGVDPCGFGGCEASSQLHPQPRPSARRLWNHPRRSHRALQSH